MTRTLADVERELKALRRRVTELGGDPDAANQAAVDELVGGTNGTANAVPGRGKFSAACKESEDARMTKALDSAWSELVENPRLVENVGLLRSFYYRHREAPTDRLAALVANAKDALNPPASYADEPEVEGGEIAKRTMAR